jgi:hypothetical protein
MNPHDAYGCDYCDGEPDDRRIQGPWRYHWPGKDVDCCAHCFERRISESLKSAFVKVGSSNEMEPARQPRSQVFELRLELNPKSRGAQRAETISSELCTQFGRPSFQSYIALVPGFLSREVAEVAARAASAVFRRPVAGPVVSLSFGLMEHESSPLRCIVATVRPRTIVESARAIAEAVKRDAPGSGQPVSIWPVPHMPLLLAKIDSEAERVGAITMVGGADALEGEPFEPACVSVWDVTASDLGDSVTVSDWVKVYEVPV